MIKLVSTLAVIEEEILENEDDSEVNQLYFTNFINLFS